MALLCQSLVHAFTIQKFTPVLTSRGEPLGVRDVRVFIPMTCIFYLKCLLILFLHTCVSKALDLRGHFNGVQSKGTELENQEDCSEHLV